MCETMVSLCRYSYVYLYFIGIAGLRIVDSWRISSHVADVVNRTEDQHAPIYGAQESGNPLNAGAKTYKRKQDTQDILPRTGVHQLSWKRNEYDLKLYQQNTSFIQGIPDVASNFTDNNVTSFEEYERKFLLNQIKNMLVQFLQFNDFQKHRKKNDQFKTDKPPIKTTKIPQEQLKPASSLHHLVTPTSPVRTNPVIAQAMDVLSKMNRTQLIHVFENISGNVEHGNIDRGIVNLCCHIG